MADQHLGSLAREIVVGERVERQRHLRIRTGAALTAQGRVRLGNPGGHSGLLPPVSGGTGHDRGAEPPLGNPPADGYHLASTAAGVRSWVAPDAGGGGAGGTPVEPVPVPAIYTPTGHISRLGILTGGGYKAFPGMCVFPQDHPVAPGRIYVAYRDGTSHAEDKGVLKRIYSDDGGLTWSAPATIASDSTYDCIEGYPIVLAGGDVLLAYTLEQYTPVPAPLADGARVRVSTDGGESYGSAVTLNSAWTDWSYCAAPALQLASGDVLVPLYGKDTGDADTGVSVLRSTDGGASFGAEVVVVDGATGGVSYYEPNIARRPDDDSLIMLIRTDGNVVYKATAPADGSAWTVPAATSITNDCGNPHMAWTASGALAVSGRRYHATLANQISTYRVSLDFGATFGPERVLDATVNRNVYTAMGELSPGVLAAVYAIEPTYNADADMYLTVLADAPPPWQAVNADMVDGWHKADVEAAIAAAVPAGLDDLGDVAAPAPAPGDVLAWDGAAWVAAPAAPVETFGLVFTNLGKVSLSNDGTLATKRY